MSSQAPTNPEPPEEPADAEAPATPEIPQPEVSEPAEPRPLLTAAPATDETVKETFESIVIAFILAFVFRAFVIEPFIIPTGSMAPTMLGAHMQMPCPSCGYRFDVGVDADLAPEGSPLPRPIAADCPMCHYEVVADVGTKVRSGDRILVDKFTYHVDDPSRWDVVVFKAPKGQTIGGEPAPRTNFIKRLVALPGERVALLDGNIFTAPIGTNDFRIARKTDPKANTHWQSIQRACWQPIYHSQYVPIESGLADGPGRNQIHAWRVPWRAVSGEWDLGTTRRPSRVYRLADGQGKLRFDVHGPYGTPQFDGQDNKFHYNQLSNSVQDESPIEDIRLACAITSETGLADLQLSTTARLDRPENGIETLRANLTSEGSLSLEAITPDGEVRQLGESHQAGAMRPGIARVLELWLVDDEASLWLDGQRVVAHRFDLTWNQVALRPKQQQFPDCQIAVSSRGPVELRRIELDRDLYYFADGMRYSSFARAEARRNGGTLDLGSAPLDLRIGGADHDAEFFVLGDNQPASEDGRGWSSVDGWVQERYFGGEYRMGVVPRSLLVGRAFMVYYPAPHGSSPQTKGIFPDFGRIRFVH